MPGYGRRSRVYNPRAWRPINCTANRRGVRVQIRRLEHFHKWCRREGFRIRSATVKERPPNARWLSSLGGRSITVAARMGYTNCENAIYHCWCNPAGELFGSLGILGRIFWRSFLRAIILRERRRKCGRDEILTRKGSAAKNGGFCETKPRSCLLSIRDLIQEAKTIWRRPA